EHYAGAAPTASVEPQPSPAPAAATSAFVPVTLTPLPDAARLALADPAATPSEAVVAQKGDGADAKADAEFAEYDPWERYNEKMFSFNYKVDKYVLKPVAKGYNFVMPDLFQQMIGHGFDNILVVPKLANNVLQWNWKGFFTELGRFLINSTLGI